MVIELVGCVVEIVKPLLALLTFLCDSEFAYDSCDHGPATSDVIRSPTVPMIFVFANPIYTLLPRNRMEVRFLHYVFEE